MPADRAYLLVFSEGLEAPYCLLGRFERIRMLRLQVLEHGVQRLPQRVDVQPIEAGGAARRAVVVPQPA
jgi:hypothetical protein